MLGKEKEQSLWQQVSHHEKCLAEEEWDSTIKVTYIMSRLPWGDISFPDLFEKHCRASNGARRFTFSTYLRITVVQFSNVPLAALMHVDAALSVAQLFGFFLIHFVFFFVFCFNYFFFLIELYHQSQSALILFATMMKYLEKQIIFS